MSTHRPTPRRGGILLHPTSLPGNHGIGDLGERAWRFVDWLSTTGLRAWQVLPLVPPGAGDSPYSSWSAFAGNPWLVDLVDLHQQGLLPASALEAPAAVARGVDRVDFAAVRAFKGPRLAAAADALRKAPGHALAPSLAAFRAREAWLAETALFAALKMRGGDHPWWEWPAPLRDRDPAALANARAELADDIERVIIIQFFFDRQWRRLCAELGRRGIELIGDLPIYVDADSADVWAERHLFALDAAGRSVEVAGVPPDAFSETGQLWGNPLYRWDAMAADGFRWWIARLRRALQLTDRVRIDHFRAFSAYWAVPGGAKDARSGRWVRGPGRAVFDALKAALGDPLPILAEDLGVIDDHVRALLAASGLPGMKVLQFAFGEDAKNPYLPHHYRPESVVYTGTHDNDTTLGWWRTVDERVRHHVRLYFAVDGHDVVWDFIRAAMASVSETAIVPMQDVLSLGSEARMNTPSVASGNWGWRVRAAALRPELAERLARLALLYGRN
ncbi:MAG: 4-alpha-glucanotransferase [Myxococcales bacterium]|nr:4-alpha-glucanotransferase [Myxococcales bacterium]